jgi:hypothetical protein
MAHFAWLDANSTVTQVSVVDNVNLLDENGDESEAVGIAYLTSVHGEGVWKQTSYNANFRGKYAGIGDFYDADLDEFVTPEITEIVTEAESETPNETK